MKQSDKQATGLHAGAGFVPLALCFPDEWDLRRAEMSLLMLGFLQDRAHADEKYLCLYVFSRAEVSVLFRQWHPL